MYFRSRDNLTVESFVSKSGLSDHDVIMCNLYIPSNVSNVQADKYKFKKVDCNLLSQLLCRMDWSDVYCSTNASLAFDIFLENFQIP